VRAQTVISLSEMSQRLNMMCVFDEKTRKITGADGKEVKPITYGHCAVVNSRSTIVTGFAVESLRNPFCFGNWNHGNHRCRPECHGDPF